MIEQNQDSEELSVVEKLKNLEVNFKYVLEERAYLILKLQEKDKRIEELERKIFDNEMNIPLSEQEHKIVDLTYENEELKNKLEEKDKRIEELEEVIQRYGSSKAEDLLIPLRKMKENEQEISSLKKKLSCHEKTIREKVCGEILSEFNNDKFPLLENSLWKTIKQIISEVREGKV